MKLEEKPIVVSDTFHFSHYYWREHATGLDDSDTESQTEAYKPIPAPQDKIKLKFYAHGE